jgi:DnaJ-class molecular chaperone
MDENGVPWSQVHSKRTAKLAPLAEIKAWRTREHAEGRPSGFDDYCRSVGLCPVCNASGVTHNENGVGYKAVGWEDGEQIFTYCEACGGTGVASGSAGL